MGLAFTRKRKISDICRHFNKLKKKRISFKEQHTIIFQKSRATFMFYIKQFASL